MQISLLQQDKIQSQPAGGKKDADKGREGKGVGGGGDEGKEIG